MYWWMCASIAFRRLSGNGMTEPSCLTPVLLPDSKKSGEDAYSILMASTGLVLIQHQLRSYSLLASIDKSHYSQS